MSKRYHENFDATEHVVKLILNAMDDFYASHPDSECYFLLYFKQIIRKVLIGWKKRMIKRHPYDFNAQMAKCTDVSKRQIERIPLKD